MGQNIDCPSQTKETSVQSTPEEGVMTKRLDLEKWMNDDKEIWIMDMWNEFSEWVEVKDSPKDIYSLNVYYKASFH